MDRTKDKPEIAATRGATRAVLLDTGQGIPVHHFVYSITALLTVLSFAAAALALSSPGARPVVAGIGVATAAHVTGFLLALILFVRIDDSLKTMRAAVLGALSGTGLVKAQAIAGYVAAQFGALGAKVGTDAAATSAGTAALFFVAIGAGMLGIIGGFAAVRLGLEREISQHESAAQDDAADLAGVGQVNVGTGGQGSPGRAQSPAPGPAEPAPAVLARTRTPTAPSAPVQIEPG